MIAAWILFVFIDSRAPLVMHDMPTKQVCEQAVAEIQKKRLGYYNAEPVAFCIKGDSK
jgi:hypothetical protein